MGYTPVKGGADAVRAAAELTRSFGAQLIADAPGERSTLDHVQAHLGAAVDRIMGEGGLFAPDLAAVAITQAEGDMDEAALLLRAYRSTLPRLGYTQPIQGRDMRVTRRISAAFKDIPGGQLLGRTRDYTHRLLDFSLLDNGGASTRGQGHAETTVPPLDVHADDHRSDATVTADASDGEGFTWPPFPKVSDTLRDIGSIAPLPEQSPEETPFDITRESLRFPVPRSAWLQSMARGETAAMVCLAYSNLRGYGYADHGTIGEVRVGSLPVKILHPVTGAAVTIGSFEATECEMFGPEGDAPVTGAKGRLLPAFGLSYGLVIGRNERKAIAMSILDSALQAGELASIDGGEVAPSNDQEMVLSHIDGIESTGFVEHLKLPHYVTFGSQIRTQMSPRRDVMLAAERTLAGITPEVATERGTGDE
jgi:alpha-D-ribose 1-methylphosphonate 5-triphosphate synthase subunit PhnI